MKTNFTDLKADKILKINDKLTVKYYTVNCKHFVVLEHFAHDEPIVFNKKTFEKLMNVSIKKNIHN